KLFENAATEPQSTELRQDEHSFDLRVLGALIDKRAAAGDLAIHAGGEESHVRLSERFHRQQMVALHRVQAGQILIKLLNELARLGRSRVFNLNPNVSHI